MSHFACDVCERVLYAFEENTYWTWPKHVELGDHEVRDEGGKEYIEVEVVICRACLIERAADLVPTLLGEFDQMGKDLADAERRFAELKRKKFVVMA